MFLFDLKTFLNYCHSDEMIPRAADSPLMEVTAMKRVLMTCLSFCFSFSLLAVPIRGRLDESIAREASAAALRGVYYLASKQMDAGHFSDDPALDRKIAKLIELSVPEAPDLGIPLEKWKKAAENMRKTAAAPRTSEAESYRNLFELVRTLKRMDSDPLLPGDFRNWRMNTATHLLEKQRGDGSWGGVSSTFYAVCSLYTIL